MPSGNFGDMMGAVLARQMGLPIKRLVVPVNGNDEFPRFLATGGYRKIEPSRACLSNAMNVGHPSNLARLVAVYGGRMDETGAIHRAPALDRMRRDLFSSSVSDERTSATIKEAWRQHRLLLEPHGAVGWRGFQDYLAVEALDGAPARGARNSASRQVPGRDRESAGFLAGGAPVLAALDHQTEDYDRLGANYDEFRDYLLGGAASGSGVRQSRSRS